MASNGRYKVVLDTNWYVSATINRRSRRTLYDILTNKKLEILYSKELLQEYQHVIARPKFAKYIRPNQATRFMNMVISELTEIKIKTFIQRSRDAKDDYLLSISVDGDADFLVTGDDDLLVLGEIGKTKVVTKSQFLEMLNESKS